MGKKLLSAVVVLLSGVGASAREPQPGYAFLTSNPKAAAPNVVVPNIAVPPEPGSLSGGPAVGGWNAPYPVGAGSGPVGPGLGALYAPAGVGHGAGHAPVGCPTPVPLGDVGYSADFGPGFALDAASSFGTETYWITGSYLWGFFTRPNLNTPLVTVGSTADLHPGGLGQPNTRIAFGQDQYGYGSLHGAKVEFGVNLNNFIYLDVSAMGFVPAYTTAVIASDPFGNPFIGRPVFNTLFNDERSYLTSSPGLVAGETRIEAKLRLFGFEANTRFQRNVTRYLSADFLLGYRRLQLEEDLRIQDTLRLTGGSITFLGTPIAAPNVISDFDRFGATNQFNGGQLGLRFRWQSGYEWLGLTGFGKVALGATNQTIEIEGQSAATGIPPVPGGVLAQVSNIGFHKRQVFGVVPEGGAGLVVMPCPYVRLHAGYSVLYWNNVVRPGDHLDRRVNPSFVPTDVNFGANVPGAFPAFSFRSRDVVLQTLSFGIEFYY
jgi:hypothetical protein